MERDIGCGSCCAPIDHLHRHSNFFYFTTFNLHQRGALRVVLFSDCSSHQLMVRTFRFLKLNRVLTRRWSSSWPASIQSLPPISSVLTDEVMGFCCVFRPARSNCPPALPALVAFTTRVLSPRGLSISVCQRLQARAH